VAAVLGHEIAHNVANHSAEKASRGFILFAIALGVAFFIDVSTQLSSMLLELGLSRPNSRLLEVCQRGVTWYFANVLYRQRRIILDYVGYGTVPLVYCAADEFSYDGRELL